MRTPVFLAVLLAAGCAIGPKKQIPAAPEVARPAQAIANPQPVVRKYFRLTAETFWRLELPEGPNFGASGLLWDEAGLLVVSDRVSTPFRVNFQDGNVARLEKTDWFSMEQLRPLLAAKRGRIDFEGIARDEAGRVYVCDESDRWILRIDPATKQVERLPIDWSPVEQFFSRSDPNASFEGIAIGGGRLWLANERERARVIEVDLQSLRVVGEFAPQPSSWGLVLHYSDLAWHDGHLFLLLRHHRVILEIDPVSHEVIAEYDYRAVEDAPEHLYLKQFPTGTMEGLAVDDSYFWLVTDNNGFGRRAAPNDRRPTLFKCPRPK